VREGRAEIFLGFIEALDQAGNVRAGQALALFEIGRIGGVLENFTIGAGFGGDVGDRITRPADDGGLLAGQGDTVDFTHRSERRATCIGRKSRDGSEGQRQG
jgi:hypothetical protein